MDTLIFKRRKSSTLVKLNDIRQFVMNAPKDKEQMKILFYIDIIEEYIKIAEDKIHEELYSKTSPEEFIGEVEIQPLIRKKPQKNNGDNVAVANKKVPLMKPRLK